MKKIILFTLLLIIIAPVIIYFTSVQMSKLSKANYSSGQPLAERYGWKYLKTAVDKDLLTSVEVTTPTIPFATDVTPFAYIKKYDLNNTNKIFGAAGVQGVWDQLYGVNKYSSDYFQQSPPTSADMDATLDHDFAMLAASNTVWVGMDFEWHFFEPKDNLFDYKYGDKIFETAQKYHINIVPMLSNSPAWAAPFSTPYTGDAPTLCIPKDLADPSNNVVIYGKGYVGSPLFNDYVKNVVSRYKPGGQYAKEHPGFDTKYGINNWVIWNEMEYGGWKDCYAIKSWLDYNASQIAGKNPNGSFSKYAQLFTGAYTTIKEVDPNAKVLNAGVTGGVPGADTVANLKELWRVFMDNQTKQPDILNFHYYGTAEGFYPHFKEVLDTRDSEGWKNKESWITEYGIAKASNQGKFFNTIKNDISGSSRTPNLFSRGLTKALWWSTKRYRFPQDAPWADTSNLNLFEDNFRPNPIYWYYDGFTHNNEDTFPDPYIEQQYALSSANVTKVNDAGKIKLSISIPHQFYSTPGTYVLLVGFENKVSNILPIMIDVLESNTTPQPTIAANPTPTTAAVAAPTTKQNRVLGPSGKNRIDIITSPKAR